jgi:hypothetical protein
MKLRNGDEDAMLDFARLPCPPGPSLSALPGLLSLLFFSDDVMFVGGRCNEAPLRIASGETVVAGGTDLLPPLAGVSPSPLLPPACEK